MESWRGQQQQQGYTYSQQNRKPPQDSWQLSVPYWEKKFCMIVGSVPWGKLVDTKRYMYLYENIVQWNDSAAEEAFKNAKSRFWEEINNLPCSLSLPDPDIYIDDIDWNSSIDPELILDLEREPEPSHDKTQDEVILGNHLLLNQSFSCTGWGEAEEDFKNKGNPETGWGEAFKNEDNPETGWGEAEDFKNKDNPQNGDWGWNADNKENPLVPVSAHSKPAIGGWGNGWNNWGNNLSGGKKNMAYRRTDGGFCGKSDANSRKKEGGGSWVNSRYKTSRFHGDHNQKDRGWRNGGRRNRVHAGYENLA